MQRLSDEELIALLDGEMEPGDIARAESMLAQDGAMRERLDLLAAGTAQVRAAFDRVLHEPVPDHLIAAARGLSAGQGASSSGEAAQASNVVQMTLRPPAARMRWIPVALAASICGLLIGAGGGYYGAIQGTQQQAAATQASATGNLLDNLAGNYKLLHGASSATEAAYDVPGDTADFSEKLKGRVPSEIKVPDLKPWGLTFQGARLIVIEGAPAAQLSYNTDNKNIGPLTVAVFSSKRPDVAPRIDQRQGVNLLYWRHAGKAVAVVSNGDKDYMWKLGNDIGYQLGAL